MKCPYLVRCAISKCKAANPSYMPSLFELQEYCGVSKNFKECSLFPKFCRREEKYIAADSGCPDFIVH